MQQGREGYCTVQGTMTDYAVLFAILRLFASARSAEPWINPEPVALAVLVSPGGPCCDAGRRREARALEQGVLVRQHGIAAGRP